jgi:hypothetical protein
MYPSTFSQVSNVLLFPPSFFLKSAPMGVSAGRRSDEEHALYLLGESFTPIALTLVDTQEEQVTWGTVFVLIHKEKRLTLALSAPVTPKQIEEIAHLVKIGLILGFVVRGEIDLGERVIHNLE